MSNCKIVDTCAKVLPLTHMYRNYHFITSTHIFVESDGHQTSSIVYNVSLNLASTAIIANRALYTVDELGSNVITFICIILTKILAMRQMIFWLITNHWKFCLTGNQMTFLVNIEYQNFTRIHIEKSASTFSR